MFNFTNEIVLFQLQINRNTKLYQYKTNFDLLNLNAFKMVVRIKQFVDKRLNC